jgi:hypothetical protein
MKNNKTTTNIGLVFSDTWTAVGGVPVPDAVHDGASFSLNHLFLDDQVFEPVVKKTFGLFQNFGQ